MGVSNVNNANKIDITKLGLLSKSKSTQSTKPAYMQMTGSIFNAPKVKQNQTTTLSTLNTDRSLKELTPKRQVQNAQISGSSKKEDTKPDNSSVQRQGEQAKAYTKNTEKNSQTVKKFQAEAKSLNKTIKNDDKKFQAKLKQQQAEITRDNAKLQKLVEQNNETQLQIENAQNELDSLLGSSSFSINGFNNTQGGQATNPNQDKINKLQQFIGTKSTLVQNNGKQIYSLQRSSARTMSRMNRTNASFVKIHKHNAKAIQKNQNETSGVIKFATKVEQYSALAEQGGKTLDLAGKAMIAAGQAMSCGFGAALIAAGTVMSKIGTVTEMLGQYGQTAANITKTTAYAAEGNLMGAMTSATAAMQTGAAAVKSTKQLNSNFKAIDQQAQEATKKAAANQTARETVKDMKPEDLNGMSKKEARKNLSKQLQSQSFGEKDANITGNWSKTQFKQYKQQMTASTDITNAKGEVIAHSTVAKEALGQVKDDYKTNISDQLKKAKLDTKYSLNDNGKIIENATGKEVSAESLKAQGLKGDVKQIKSALKKGSQKTTSAFANKASKAMKSTRKFDFANFTQGLMSTAALFNAQNTGYAQGSKGNASQWNLDADPKMRRIRKSRVASMNHAAYV